MSKSKPPLPSGDRSECVKVAVRCRPLNDLEKSRSERSIVEMDGKNGTISLMKTPGGPIDNSPGGENKNFTFDNVFPPGTAQMKIYNDTARPIVESVLSGYNVKFSEFEFSKKLILFYFTNEIFFFFIFFFFILFFSGNNFRLRPNWNW